jgi:TRAP-type C4-dicarboxylate transport system permease small subunit
MPRWLEEVWTTTHPHLPNMVAATLLGAGMWAGAWAHRRIDELTRASADRLTEALGSVAHVAVVVFTAMMALQQLGVRRQLIAIAFGLVLGAVCLALALAFGLGGRDVAARIVHQEYERRRRP